jgi:carboxy-cis,cis-muconate cyclase
MSHSARPQEPPHHFIVGTFNTNLVFTLAFDPVRESLEVVKINEGQAPHSWLALSVRRRLSFDSPPHFQSGNSLPPLLTRPCAIQDDKCRLYATSWTVPPAIASYAVSRSSPSSPPSITHLSSVVTAARSGYVCVSSTHAYSAGGPTGEVFSIDAEGGLKEEVQKLDFVDARGQTDNGDTMDFGGLRHGSHSFDLSPDGKLAYVADMCVFFSPYLRLHSDRPLPPLPLLSSFVPGG